MHFQALKQVEVERTERLRTEKKLKLAEDALFRLDKALRDSGVKIDVGIEVFESFYHFKLFVSFFFYLG